MNIAGLVFIAAGTYGLLLAIGAISGWKDPQKMATWRRKWGPLMKVSGPMAILYGIAELFGLLH